MTRRNAIYTIGKLTNRNRSYLLLEAFPFYLKRDPINLPRLILEMVWLTNEWDWEHLEQVGAANHYLVRWCLCQVLDSSGGPEEIMRRFLALLAKLKHDSHPLVAAEANLRFERVNVKLQPKLPKPEWRKEVKRIANLEPKIKFETSAMQFIQNRTDYSLEDFDRFVTKLAV